MRLTCGASWDWGFFGADTMSGALYYRFQVEPALRIRKRMMLKVMDGSLGQFWGRSLFAATAVLIASVVCVSPAYAAPARQPMDITGYVITADIDPATNHLAATAEVTVTANEDLTAATFELNNGLNISKLTDKTGAALTSERLTQNSTVRVTLPNSIAKG